MHECLSKSSFSKSLSPGQNWKSKSMVQLCFSLCFIEFAFCYQEDYIGFCFSYKPSLHACLVNCFSLLGFLKRIIPEEFLRSSHESFEHRVVFIVPWNNSWQFWLHPDKKGLFMIKEDWDEFVGDNFLSPDDTLVFTHQDTMYFQVQIFKKDGKEIISAPLGVEPKKETTSASTSGNTIQIKKKQSSCSLNSKPLYFISKTKRWTDYFFMFLYWLLNFQQVEEQLLEGERVVLMCKTLSDTS